MRIVHSIDELRRINTDWRFDRQRIAFVPTMGNVHAGHLQLVKQAAGLAERVIVSIFVNPLQFNDQRDYQAYPQTFDSDCRQLSDAGAALLYAPVFEELYPYGLAHGVRVEIPGLSDILEGEFRPGHFIGMTTIVAKLFNVVQADVALFGEKDFQQLLLVKRLVADLCLPVTIVACETVREADGLALSSRNSYLDEAERNQAASLYRVISRLGQQLREGTRDYASLSRWAMEQLVVVGFRPEYVEIRRADDLAAPQPADRELVVLAAAWLGKARLIDNVRISLKE